MAFEPNIEGIRIKGALTGLTSVSAVTYYGDGSNLTGISGGGGTFTGGTVTGPTNFTNGLTATTISATTYFNLPTDVFTTGGTYNNGTGVATFANNTGGTFNVSGFYTGQTDTFVTGFTYSDNVFTVKQNNNQADLSVLVNTMTGLTATTLYTDYIDFNTGATVTNQAARLSWDDGNGTLAIPLKGGNVNLQIGQENVVLCYNSEATQLVDGEIVYVDSSQGNRPSVKRALATSDGYSVTTLGMVTETINSGAEGFVTTFGMVNNLNTIGYSGGTAIWLSPTVAGAFTDVKPQAPYHSVLLGYVVRVHASVGSIFVHISNGWELEELHNVRLTGETAGDLLSYSAYNGSNVWVNTKTLNGSYTITGNTTIGGVMKANTVSATTYQNLPIDVRVTGATYDNNNTFTFTNNTGNTFDVLFNTVSGLTVDGILSATTISATTFYGDGSNLSGTTPWSQSGTSIYYNDGNVGIGTDTPVDILEVTDGTSTFATNLDNSNGPLISVTTTNTDGLIRFSATDGTSSINIGTVGTTYSGVQSFGAPSDSYIYSNSSANGLNIISQPGIGTEDYIRFYAGVNPTTATASIHIQGDGSTTGYVGIGTETPSEILEVVQNTEKFRLNLDFVDGPQAILSTTQTDLVSRIVASDGVVSTGMISVGNGWTGSTVYGNPGDSSIYSNTSANGINIISAPGTGTEDYIRFYAGGNPQTSTASIHIDGDGANKGWVGIGTETPQNPLHLYGNTSSYVMRVSSNASTSRIQFEDSATTNTPFIGANDNVLEMGIGTGGTKMSILENGNVGIGTGVPTDKLTVLGSFNLREYGNIYTVTGNTAGWYRIGYTSGGDRGGIRVLISYVGGNWTPTTYVINAFKNWNINASLSLEKYGQSNYVIEARIVEDEIDSTTYHLEVYLQSLTVGHNARIYFDKNLGYEGSWNLNTDSLSASTSVANPVARSPFTSTSDGYTFENVILNNNLNNNFWKLEDGDGFLYFKDSNSDTPLTLQAENNFVGINNTSPLVELDVSGDTKISGTLNIGTLGTGTSVTNLGIDGSGNVVSGDTGEVNTASNLGGGIGIFEQKSGVDLQFKSLTSTGGTVTISNDANTVNLEVIPASNFTGGTVTGETTFTNGLITNTISATTYQNLPTDVFVTGGTYANGSLSFNNNTGGTFNIITSSNYAAGVISGATGWSSTGAGQINLPSVKVALYNNSNNIEPIIVYDVASGTTNSGGIPSLTDNDTNYIVIEYNGGSPIYNVYNNDGVVNDSDVVLAYIVYRLGNFVHVLEFGNQGAGLANKLNDRVIMTERFGWESGLTLGLSGSTGVVTLTSGVAWNGSYRQSLTAVNSQDDIFFKNYHSGGTWTYTTTGDTLNNSYYDNGTNIVLATGGKYLVNYYYRGQETNDHLYEVYGTTQYDSVNEAEAATNPELPELISSHAFLVGRIIVLVGATTGVTQTAFATVFSPSGYVPSAGDHNNLTGLQGGSAGQYYHLTSDEYNNNAYTNVDNNFSTGQTINGTVTVTDSVASNNNSITSDNLITMALLYLSNNT